MELRVVALDATDATLGRRVEGYIFRHARARVSEDRKTVEPTPSLRAGGAAAR